MASPCVRLPLLCTLLFALPAACGDSKGETTAGTSPTEATMSGTGLSTGSGGAGSDSDGSSGPSGSDSESTTGGTATTDTSPTTETGSSDSDATTQTTTTTGPTDSDATTGDPGWGCLPDDQLGATLTGTVWAPNGTIPVSGALVYASPTKPDPIPQTVYCAECVELTCNQYDTLTLADGTFTLKTPVADAKYLVVQKGQFLRITEIDIPEGETALADEITTLPGENDPASDLYIPKIAVADGSFDRLEDAFGKFGLGDTMIASYEERLVPGTASFDLWENGRDPGIDGHMSEGAFSQLIQNYPLMEQYHVIFVPCSSDVYTDLLNDPQVLDNIRTWVANGGRWYVSDWANEWIRLVFDQYQDFELEFGSADLSSYDSLALVLDSGLLEWLQALPDVHKDINPLNDEQHPTLYDLPQVQTVDNWSSLMNLNQVLVDDGMGGQVDVGHKAWLEGPYNGDIRPLTVTGQYGCGKIQFTSYHAAEFFNYVGLSPQELVLFYTILEIGVCQSDLPIPE